MEKLKRSSYNINNFRRKPISHDGAILGGDRYLFNDDENEEDTEDVEDESVMSNDANDSLESSNTAKFKMFMKKQLIEMMKKMRDLSKNYRHVVKVLAQDKSKQTDRM